MTRLITLICAATMWLLLSGCDHEAVLHTRLNEDGSLIKTIELKDADPEEIRHNYFGISAENGWEVEQEATGEKDKKLNLRFTRSFPSAEAFTETFSHDTDSLFWMQASFSRDFRWFFTYISYQETFKAADRFDRILQEDYFTPEEYAFIERMPAEGGPVSHADSLFAEALNKKIMDQYAIRGIFEDHYGFFEDQIDAFGLPPAWKDTLRSNKEDIFKVLTSKEGEDFDDDVMLDFMDSLQIPFPRQELTTTYLAEMKRLESELNFMSWAADGTFSNYMEVPWTVVSTNADSVNGNRLSWNPPAMKYLLQDYTMQVTTRKLNGWMILVTVAGAALLGIILFRLR